MHEFKDDDSGYLAWVHANPGGFVANVPWSGQTVASRLHSARCSFVASPARDNYTGPSYYKVCSLDRDQLVRWLQQQGRPWTICKLRQCQEGVGIPRVATSDVDMVSLVQPSRAALSLASVPVGRSTVHQWQLWTAGDVLQEIDVARPFLASWNRGTDPAQVRLHAYLAELEHTLRPVIADRRNLFIHLDIALDRPEHVSQGHDVENYLTPVVTRLGPTHFTLVTGRKRVGGGSRLSIGQVQDATEEVDESRWHHCACHAGSGVSAKPWKEGVRAALLNAQAQTLPPGPVDVQVAWRCRSHRNWAALWKPTGDAMGPVLGEPDPRHPFSPADDRIVSLSLHLNVDDTMGHDVDVGMWWRSHL